MAVEPLSAKEITDSLTKLPGWELDDQGHRIARTYRLAGHLQGADMVGHVARIQEELNHHADLTLGYNTLRVSVNTHSVGGRITKLDFALARRIEEIAPEHGAR